MRFCKAGDYSIESDAGYVISKVRYRGCWVYLSWTPVDPDWRSKLKANYRRGEAVPAARRIIGRHESAADAIAVCRKHHESKSAAA